MNATFREAFTRRLHGIMCRPGRIPKADWGCCGCGAAEMDAYITVGCRPWLEVGR